MPLSQIDLIKLLTRAGQAAIVAEILVIVVFYAVFLITPEYAMADITEDESNIYAPVEAILDLINSNFALYTGFNIASMGVPTVIMLGVAWALHIYFSANGVYLMNWVASSVAMIGAAQIIASLGVNVWGLQVLLAPYEAGDMPIETLYAVYSVGIALQANGIVFLYVMFPFLLMVVAWRDRLLPYWFMATVSIVIVVNDIILLEGVNASDNLSALQSFIVLQPFIIGVMILLKARELTKAYITHHTLHTPATEEETIVTQ